MGTQSNLAPYSLFYSLYLCLKLWLFGIRDAFRFDVIFRAMRNSTNIRQVLTGVLLNALSFFFVLTFFRDFPYTIVSSLFSFAPDCEEKEHFVHYTNLLCQVISLCFLYVMYYSWTIWNFIWIGGLATDSYRIFKGDPPQSKNSPLHEYIARDVIFRLLSNIIFTLHILLIAQLPPFGRALSCFFFGCFFTFQCFEVPWVIEGRPLVQQMKEFESNWPYFIGFGTPVMILYFCFSGVVLLAVIASFTPLVSISFLFHSPSPTLPDILTLFLFLFSSLFSFLFLFFY